MIASTSAFIIRELTGDRRIVRLSGRALPYRPFTLSGSQRHDLTWYGGSPEGTLQIQGAKEDPTSIKGKWKDRFIKPISSLSSDELQELGFSSTRTLGGTKAAGQNGEFPAQLDGEPILNVRDLADLIDDIRKKGQHLEITWLDKVRRGILHRFLQSWFTAQDLEYEITFVWNSQEERLSDIPVQTKNIDVSDSIQEIDNEIESITDIFGSGTDNPQQPSNALDIGLAGTEVIQALNNIDDAITDIKRASLDLENAVITNVQIITSPLETGKRAAGLFDFMKRRAASITNLVSSTFEAFALNTDSTFGERLRRRRELKEVRDSSITITSIAAIRQQQMQKQLNPELIRTIIAVEGQDLRDISREIFGTPDSWRSLMVFNNLSSPKLEKGQLVFVPRTPPEHSC